MGTLRAAAADEDAELRALSDQAEQTRRARTLAWALAVMALVSASAVSATA